ncbi:MAG: hypothetical protein ACM3PT_07380 [Deltaproteobacteria bacterium]
MSTFKFKTSINCNGCIIKAKRVLDTPEIENWNVDVDNPEKILTVETKILEQAEIIQKLNKIGFLAEALN